MAKTCFYCGRVLAPGERCNCRTNASHTQTGSAESGSNHAGSTSYTSGASSTGAYTHGTSSGNATGTSSTSAHAERTEKKQKKQKEQQVWNESSKKTPTFSAFITKTRSIFPSLSKLLRPVFSYIWHPVTTIQNRSQVVPIPKMILVNSLFALLTSTMVVFTSHTDSPFLGMLISLVFGRVDLIAAHPYISLLVFSVILWVCVLILAGCFTLTSRLVNRKLSFLRALDTVSMSSIYLCFADVLIFISVLLGSRGAFTLIFVAFVVMGIAHFVSIKQDLALSDNATFNMLAISYLEFYVLAQLAVNTLLRILMHFRG